jgi:hypothetical protein
MVELEWLVKYFISSRYDCGNHPSKFGLFSKAKQVTYSFSSSPRWWRYLGCGRDNSMGGDPTLEQKQLDQLHPLSAEVVCPDSWDLPYHPHIA